MIYRIKPSPVASAVFEMFGPSRVLPEILEQRKRPVESRMTKQQTR